LLRLTEQAQNTQKQQRSSHPRRSNRLEWPQQGTDLETSFVQGVTQVKTAEKQIKAYEMSKLAKEAAAAQR
jgi:hypothetical protein